MKAEITFPKAKTLAEFIKEAEQHKCTVKVLPAPIFGPRGQEPVRYISKDDAPEKVILPNKMKDTDTLEPIMLAQWARTLKIPCYEILIENIFDKERKMRPISN